MKGRLHGDFPDESLGREVVVGSYSEPRIWGRGWYFGGITVDPRNPDHLLAIFHIWNEIIRTP